MPIFKDREFTRPAAIFDRPMLQRINQTSKESNQTLQKNSSTIDSALVLDLLHFIVAGLQKALIARNLE